MKPTGQGLFNHLIAGAAGGAVAKTITAPLDRVKIIYQTGSERFRLSLVPRALLRMGKEEGLAALWRGHSATLMRVAPYAGAHFAAHDKLSSLAESHLPGEGFGRAARRFATGACAGAFATMVTYPLDVLRARLAVQQGRRSALSAALMPGRLFSGLGPTLLGIMPYAGVTWATYLTLSERLPDERNKPWQSALAGLTGQTASYPLDVARRRMQTGETGSALTILHRAIEADGIGAAFRGVQLTWIKGPVASAAAFMVHERLARFLVEHRARPANDGHLPP